MAIPNRMVGFFGEAPGPEVGSRGSRDSHP